MKHHRIFPSEFAFLTYLLLAGFTTQIAFAQAVSSDTPIIPDRLPAGLELKEYGPQRYRMVTDYINHDILGNFQGRSRITGTYTRGFEDGTVQWNEVVISHSQSEHGEFPAGDSLSYMENFRYTPSENMVQPDAFPGFPAESIQAKNLVWDVLGFEGFAWYYFDALKLNEPLLAGDMNKEIPLAGIGTFTNRNIELTYTGFSEMHGEPCALISFNAMDNPLEIDMEMFHMTGRSHYWGTVWVSLQDKQIEHALLYEDVVMKIKMGDWKEAQLSNTTRKIVLTKQEVNF